MKDDLALLKRGTQPLVYVDSNDLGFVDSDDSENDDKKQSGDQEERNVRKQAKEQHRLK